MPRSIDASVLAAWRSSNPDHVSLIEIATGDTTTPFIRRTDREYDLTFNSATFTAIPPEYGQIQVESHTEQGGIDLKIPDTDGALAALALASYTFRSTRVRIWITSIVATGGSGSNGLLSKYFVESVDCEDGAVTFHLRSSFAAFDVALPRGTLTLTDFPFLPQSIL